MYVPVSVPRPDLAALAIAMTDAARGRCVWDYSLVSPSDALLIVADSSTLVGEVTFIGSDATQAAPLASFLDAHGVSLDASLTDIRTTTDFGTIVARYKRRPPPFAVMATLRHGLKAALLAFAETVGDAVLKESSRVASLS